MNEEEKKEKELEDEGKLLWDLKDKLKKNVPLKIVKEMLDLNGQSSKGGEQVLLERCSYGMLFGALPGCAKDDCIDNFLLFSNSTGEYHCQGSTEWGKCNWKGSVSDVEVSVWQVPEDTEIEMIDNYKYKERKKLNYLIERKFKEIPVEEKKKKKKRKKKKRKLKKLKKNQKEYLED